ncbi:uncharacterized protein LOC115802321 [Delphinapterus leucas]|uniref:Uncharacterized protein LOC115802321 n=1 Tax=Delphinapterus leucas TaxID=9749 RepID=A0A7F8K7K4_DELLE|nr:uncharacterized protein LOC115802321 [Delphinapterus leucas]
MESTRNCARRIFWPLEGADSPPAPSARAGASKPPGQGRRAAEAGAPGPPARPPRSLRADAPRRSLETQTACHHAAVLRLQKDGLRTSTNNLTSQAVAFVLFSLDPVPHRPLTHSCQPPRRGKVPGQRGQSPGNATRLTCAPGSRQAGLRWGAGGEGARPRSRASLSRGATSVGREAAVARDRAPGQGRQQTSAGAAQEADRCPRGETDSSPAFPFALVPPPVLFALQQRSWALFGLKMSVSAGWAQVGGGGRAEPDSSRA